MASRSDRERLAKGTIIGSVISTVFLFALLAHFMRPSGASEIQRGFG